MDSSSNAAKLTLAIGCPLVLLAVVIFPLLVIWALNTLFVLKIEYTLANWFASLVLVSVVYGPSATLRGR